MKKIVYVLGIVVSICMTACNKEDNLTPSLLDNNWWVNVDNPDDPLDHLIFGIYKQYKVPIFYNDTIGCREEKDAFGNTVAYYEIIKLNYTILGGVSDANVVEYSLSKDRNLIMDGVELLRDYVLPKLPDFVPAPKSYLLVDTVWRGIESDQQIPYSASAYAGMTAVAVGKLHEIKNMTPAEKMLFGGEILAAPVASTIFDNYASKLEEGFYKEVKKLTQYGGYSYGAKVQVGVSGIFNPSYAHWYEYGFLYPAQDKKFIENEYYEFPSKKQDVEDFVALCLGFTEAEVEATYGRYEHIMNKYNYMMEIMDLLKNEK